MASLREFAPSYICIIQAKIHIKRDFLQFHYTLHCHEFRDRYT